MGGLNSCKSGTYKKDNNIKAPANTDNKVGITDSTFKDTCCPAAVVRGCGEWSCFPGRCVPHGLGDGYQWIACPALDVGSLGSEVCALLQMMAMDATAMSRSTSDAQQGAHWSGVARCLEFSFLQMMAMDGTAM